MPSCWWCCYMRIPSTPQQPPRPPTTKNEVLFSKVSRRYWPTGPFGLYCFTSPYPAFRDGQDRKSTRLNSSHANISYAVFCLKKKIYTLSTPLVSQAKASSGGDGTFTIMTRSAPAIGRHCIRPEALWSHRMPSTGHIAHDAVE